MLENLDTIKWKSLKTAHGDASHIPEAIRGLISNNEQIRRKSYWKIDNYAVLQSDLYEAAFYVIPFLLEILSSDIVEGRERIYDLLYEIGNGYAPDEYKIRNNDGTLSTLREACRKPVLDEINLYIEELRNRNSPARKQALDLLFSLEEANDVIIDVFTKLLSDEPEGELRKEMEKMLTEILAEMNS